MSNVSNNFNGGDSMNSAKVLNSLRPGASWVCNGEDYNQLQWFEPPVWEGGQKKPTKEEWDAEWERQTKISELSAYKMKRMMEYPPMVDYIDAVVKGDTEQMQAYIDACLAVKAKYPKPEGMES